MACEPGAQRTSFRLPGPEPDVGTGNCRREIVPNSQAPSCSSHQSIPTPAFGRHWDGMAHAFNANDAAVKVALAQLALGYVPGAFVSRSPSPGGRPRSLTLGAPAMVLLADNGGIRFQPETEVVAATGPTERPTHLKDGNQPVSNFSSDLISWPIVETASAAMGEMKGKLS